MKTTAMIMAASAFCLWMPLTTTSTESKEPTAKESTGTDDNKIRCRRVEVTGSLVKKTKICRTVAEWRALATKGNQNAREIFETGQVCSGGPMCNGS